jgi:hypothetical protein
MSDEALIGRSAALLRAAELARGWVDDDAVERAQDTAQSVAERERVYDRWVVAALAGGTGSGKSTLFNALVGREVVATGVRRPTTNEATAAIAGDLAGGATLLDFLQIPRRREAPSDGLLPRDVVLIDLPDHDSDAVEHRLEVDRLVEKVDVLVWVVDPEKYADAELHEGYLRPLAEHAGTFIVFLNQVDTIPEADRGEIVDDLARLLRSTGLERAQVAYGSALRGDGVSALGEELGRRVADGLAVREKLEADLRVAVGELRAGCGEEPPRISVDEGLAERIAEAAGAREVGDQAADNYARDAAASVGWFLGSWRQRLWARMRAKAGMPKPPRSTGEAIAVPPVAGAAATQVGSLALEPLTDLEQHLPATWAGQARRVAEDDLPDFTATLDRELRSVDFSYRRPWWWSLGFGIQSLLGVATLVGALWLTALFLIGWLQLPDPPVPELQEVPLPTALLLGGLGLGWLLGWIGRQLSRRGATRQRTAARQRMRAVVQTVIDDSLIPTLEANRGRRDEILAALEDVEA